MMHISKNLYEKSPTFLKSIFASIWGYYLNQLRYGNQTESMISKSILRETWDSKSWKSYHNNRLSMILQRAATKVPYYKLYWEEQREKKTGLSREYLENWPIISKDAVRKNPKAFIADDCKPSRMYVDHTSGTSGTPLQIYQSKQTIRCWYALAEARWRRWYGISRKDRWAIFGGQLIANYNRQKPPFWVWNAGMNQLYCSSYHLAPGNINHYLDALRSHHVVYILGYPSALYTLARYGTDQNLKPPEVKFLLSNAEPLYQHQIETIQIFFNAPIYDTYGMAETLCAASECKYGVMHLWPEASIYEVLDKNGQPVNDGKSGRLVCTGLINPDMPLIRYDTGDQVVIDRDFSLCECGRTLPKLAQIEGRSDDLIITSEGREIGRLDPIFKSEFRIREAQIIQEDIDQFIIRYVKADNFKEEDLQAMKDALCKHVGDVRVVFQSVNHIPRTKTGKFRAVISKVK